jgi:hypothetical protein
MLYIGYSGSVIGVTDSVTTAWMACPGESAGCIPGDNYIMTAGPSTYAAAQTWTNTRKEAQSDVVLVHVWLETWQITSTTEGARVLTLNYNFPAAGGNTTTHTDLPKTLSSGEFHYTSYPLTGGLELLSLSTTSSGIATAHTSSVTPTPTGTSSGGGLSPGAKAGIGVGVSVAVLLNLAVIVWCIWRRRKRTPKRNSGDWFSRLKPELAGQEVKPKQSDNRTAPELIQPESGLQELPAVVELDSNTQLEMGTNIPHELEAGEVKPKPIPEADAKGNKQEHGM